MTFRRALALLVWSSVLFSLSGVLAAQTNATASSNVVSLPGPGLSELIVEVPAAVRTTSNGLVITEPAGWVRSKQFFRNFRLRFDAQIESPSTRALVAVRGLPEGAGSPWVAYALPVAGIEPPKLVTPADMQVVWFSLNPTGAAKALGPWNQWQTYDITCTDDRMSTASST